MQRKVPRLSEDELQEPAFAGSRAKKLRQPTAAGPAAPADSLDQIPTASSQKGVLVRVALILLAGVAVGAAVFMALRGGGDGESHAAAMPDAGAFAALDEAADPAGATADAAVEKDDDAPAKGREERGRQAGKAVERDERAERQGRSGSGRREESRDRKSGPEKEADSETEKPDDKEPSKITIDLLVVPPSATVIARGRRDGNRLIVKKGKEPISITIQASGYESKRVEIVPNQDRELVVQLSPESPKGEEGGGEKAEPEGEGEGKGKETGTGEGDGDGDGDEEGTAGEGP